MLHLYVAVLSSLPQLRGSGDGAGAGASGMDMDFGGTAGGGAGGGPGANGGRGASCMELPLYLDDWVAELFERVTTLVSNLDTGPGHRTDLAAPTRSDTQGSFLLAVGRAACMWLICSTKATREPPFTHCA